MLAATDGEGGEDGGARRSCCPGLGGAVGARRARALALRRRCAAFVAARPERFDEATLGRPTAAYGRWIARRTNWGGEIELVVLSELLRVDIAVWSPFEGAEPLRYRCDDPTGEIHLLYSGTHYDAFVARTKGGDTVARFPAGGDPALEARIEALLATAIAEASKRGSA